MTSKYGIYIRSNEKLLGSERLRTRLESNLGSVIMRK